MKKSWKAPYRRRHHHLYGKVLRNFLLPLGDVIFGQKLISRLRLLEEGQWWSRDRIEAYQRQNLRALIDTCYNQVPLYRSLFDSHGIDPRSIRDPSDLKRIPVVTKNMFREGYPNKTTRTTGQRQFESKTSGSTGSNFVVRTDGETFGHARATLLLCLQWAGWRFGEPQLQTGMTLSRDLGRKLKDVLLRCHYVSAFDLRDQMLKTHLEQLEHRKLDHLWGYPGSLYELARYARSQGWNRPLRSIVTWGDNLHPHYRTELESVFGTKVFDTYGCAEGIQVSAQCGQGQTYHLHDLDTLVDCVDDEGQPVADNTMGNLVLTRLHPGPMPLLRYQVGDLGQLGPAKPCACGRQWRTMFAIAGRDTDHILTPGGNRLIVHFFTGILEHFDGIESFQATQETLETMHLRIVPNRKFRREDVDRVREALRERGADLTIEIELVDEIPLPLSGKRRFVTSSLKRQGHASANAAGPVAKSHSPMASQDLE